MRDWAKCLDEIKVSTFSFPKIWAHTAVNGRMEKPMQKWKCSLKLKTSNMLSWSTEIVYSLGTSDCWRCCNMNVCMHVSMYVCLYVCVCWCCYCWGWGGGAFCFVSFCFRVVLIRFVLSCLVLFCFVLFSCRFVSFRFVLFILIFVLMEIGQEAQDANLNNLQC